MTSIWIAPRPLLLASTSRTRILLLEQAGLPVDTQAPGVDERAVEASAEAERLNPPALAQRLAAEKSLAVSRKYPERLVLGADQVLECAGTLFHKPADRAAARDQLLSLADRSHCLHSAGVLTCEGRVIDSFAASATLTMRSLRPQDVDHYLDIVDPSVLLGVGVYQIEGVGIHLFERIEGDHATILGLPLLPLLAALRRCGVLAF